MVYDGIVLVNGKYEVYVKYQDGTDHAGPFSSAEKAKAAWVKGHKQWNGTKRKASEAPIYHVQPAITQQLVRIK